MNKQNKKTPQEKFDKLCRFESWVKVVEPIQRKNTIKQLVAYGLIGFGVITLPLPTGSIFLIVLGLGMLGLSKYKFFDMLRRKRKLLLYKLKSKGFRK